ATRVPEAGCPLRSPACASRLKLVYGGSPTKLSRIPPCTVTLCPSEMSKRCSTRTCGIHPQRFPAYPNVGTASAANEVGESGEMKAVTFPRLSKIFSNTKPDSLTRYFDALSTFV